MLTLRITNVDSADNDEWLQPTRKPAPVNCYVAKSDLLKISFQNDLFYIENDGVMIPLTEELLITSENFNVALNVQRLAYTASVNSFTEEASLSWDKKDLELFKKSLIEIEAESSNAYRTKANSNNYFSVKCNAQAGHIAPNTPAVALEEYESNQRIIDEIILYE